MTMMSNTEFDQRLAELESRISFQELAITDMSDALAQARIESTRHALLLKQALDDLRSLRTMLYADPGNEPPPPHY